MSYTTVIEKFNPYHDKLGKFTSSDGAHSVTAFTRNPDKQYLVDRFKEKSGAKGRKKPVDHIDWKEESAERSMGNLYEFHDRCVEVFGDLVHKASNINESAKEKVDDERGFIQGYEVFKLLGNDAKPTVVSHEEFEKLIADGSPDYYRGFDHQTKDNEIVKDGAQKAQEFLKGKNFVGYGLYGCGTYVAQDNPGSTDGLLEAASYGNSKGDAKDNVLRMTVKRGSFIADSKTIDDEIEAFCKQADNILNGAKRAYSKGKLADGGSEVYEEVEQLRTLLSDKGVYAAARGYDGYESQPGSYYYILVNRGAVIVDEEIKSSEDEFAIPF